MAGRDIKFKVKLLDQSVQDLELDASTLCSEVKLVLEALTNIPATRQRLIFRGRVLRDDSSLQELGIEDGHSIHLIERSDSAAGGAAPTAAGAGATAAGARGAPDFNSLLQGVFSALGNMGPPPAAGAGAAAAAGAAGQQGQGPQPTHLLQSIADFLQQLQSQPGAGADVAMPVTSLALGGTTGTLQLQSALTAALRHILSGQPLTAGQQAQLAAAASTAAATGATAAGAGTAGTYPHMQLVLAALGLLLTRTQAYLTGPLAANLTQGAQQLAGLAQQQGVNVAEASQALSRVSGQLQAAAALLVELARAASASSVELAGSNPLLTANTAAVLQQDEGRGTAAGRLAPAFPTLYPQLPPGMGGDRNAGRPVSLALPDFSNPADVLQFAGRLTNTVLTGLGTGIAAGSNAPAAAAAGQPAPAAAAAAGGVAGAAPAAAAAPSSAQVAQMVAAALTSSLAPVIERVSADVAGAVRTGRGSISSGQFQQASSTAANVAAQTVSGTVGRVLTSVTETLNRNLSGIEQRLQEVERESGRQVNAIDIAAAVQHVLLPHMQPLGDVLGAAARAAASSAAAANAAAATAATAAHEAANAAAAAGQAAAAAAATPAASAPPAPAAAAAPPAAAAAGGAEAGSSSSGSGGPRGLGLGAGLRSGALPAKRKAQGAAGAETGAAADASPAAAAAGGAGSSAAAGGSSSAGAARPAVPAPGAAGRGAPPPDLGALMQMMMGGAAGGASGSGGQQQQPRQAAPGSGGAAGGGGDLGALMQMMMGGAAGGAAGSGGQQQQPRQAVPGGGGAAGGAGDLSGLMQMMGGMLGGGGGGGGGAGGMGGLLQMAGQIASDPAMQPLISGVANAVLGGGGGAGGAGGLGGLLGGLLGPGMGGPGGSGARSATVVASMDDLEQELPADVAAEWRRVLGEDERAQALAAMQGRGPLSGVYQAGAPTAGRRGIIPGLPV